MKRIKWILMCLLCPVVAVAGGPGGAPPARVVTAPVVEKLVAESTEVVGSLYFDRVSRLSSEVSGLAHEVYFREGDTVKKGAVLIRLKTDFIKKEIQSVLARMAQLHVRIKKAEKDLARYETLYRQEAVSEQEYDDMALSREDLLKQRVILERDLELARLKEAKSVIRAPFGGIVLEKSVAAGNWIAPGTGLCRIASLEDLYVKVAVSERMLPYAKKGMSVQVVVNGLGREVTGLIEGILPVADPRTKNVFLKVKLPEVAGAVLNMSATVRVPVGEKRSMVLIPRDALVSFNGSDLVYRIDGGKAAPVPVRVLTYSGGYAGVDKSGFAAGTQVVVDGNDRLRPGQQVEIIGQEG